MCKIRKLTKNEIECRVARVSATGCSLLLYKTARVDRAILDEVYGDLWQNDFKVIDGKMYGGIGIYNKDLNEWLWRWDCGVESNTEAEKGQASDCFKRAGFKWGIGIELYSAPFIWVNAKTNKRPDGKYELEDKFAKFTVKEIGYSDLGEINKLIITDNHNRQVFKLGASSEQAEMPFESNQEFAEEITRYGTTELVCSKCGTEISQKVADYSEKNFGAKLCMKCQKEV